MPNLYYILGSKPVKRIPVYCIAYLVRGNPAMKSYSLDHPNFRCDQFHMDRGLEIWQNTTYDILSRNLQNNKRGDTSGAHHRLPLRWPHLFYCSKNSYVKKCMLYVAIFPNLSPHRSDHSRSSGGSINLLPPQYFTSTKKLYGDVYS